MGKKTEKNIKIMCKSYIEVKAGKETECVWNGKKKKCKYV